MLRINRVYIALLLSFFFLVFVFLICFDGIDKKNNFQSLDNINFSKQKNAENFTCLIEGVKRLQCLKKGGDVYLPFYKFIKKQFDVDGKLNEGKFC